MSSVVISGDTSGAVTVSVPAVAGTNTVTIAAQTGTLNAAGPAFSAYLASNQTVTTNVNTKILFDTEVFDTNNNFASNKFTPTIAGYYQINITFAGQTDTTLTYLQGALYKNGSIYKYGVISQTTLNQRWSMSDLVYMNGSTDYLEVYCQLNGAGTLVFVGSSTGTSFSGALVRGA